MNFNDIPIGETLTRMTINKVEVCVRQLLEDIRDRQTIFPDHLYRDIYNHQLDSLQHFRV